jgi:TonB family protein
MAHSPVPGREFPAVANPPVLPPLESLTSTQVAVTRNPEEIFSALGQFIAGTQDVDVILGAIAEAAQSLTQSSGIAIAMLREGVVICLARSGDTAPALGTRLSVDSGISGECLRTGNTLRCDDATKDYRADQEVCRQLGLRSIAAVPLRHWGETVGILEAFSGQRCSFAEEHMDVLVRLARLAEAAAFESDAEVQAASHSQPRADLDVARPLNQISGAVTARRPRAVPSERRQYYRVAAVVVAMLVLFSVVGWRLRRNSAAGVPRSPQQSPAAVPAQPTTQAETTEVLSLAVPATKPSPAHSRIASDTARSLDVVQRASKMEAAPVTTPNKDSPDLGEHAYPPVARPATDAAGLVSLLSAPPTLPELATPISQGLSGGQLVRQVRPVYPPQALRLHLSGSVVLQTTIAEDGTIRDLRVVSGYPLLARAAVDAVHQWRYRPYLLNGKPTSLQTNITINFKLP